MLWNVSQRIELCSLTLYSQQGEDLHLHTSVWWSSRHSCHLPDLGSHRVLHISDHDRLLSISQVLSSATELLRMLPLLSDPLLQLLQLGIVLTLFQDFQPMSTANTCGRRGRHLQFTVLGCVTLRSSRATLISPGATVFFFFQSWRCCKPQKGLVTLQGLDGWSVIQVPHDGLIRSRREGAVKGSAVPIPLMCQTVREFTLPFCFTQLQTRQQLLGLKLARTVIRQRTIYIPDVTEGEKIYHQKRKCRTFKLSNQINDFLYLGSTLKASSFKVWPPHSIVQGWWNRKRLLFKIPFFALSVWKELYIT